VLTIASCDALVEQASQSRWLRDTDAIPVRCFRRTAISETGGFGTAPVSDASYASRHAKGSIEGALLLKIHEAKQMRTAVTLASSVSSPRRLGISPTLAKLMVDKSPEHLIQTSDMVTLEQLASIVANSTVARPNAATQRHKSLALLDAQQLDSRPLEPPIPHRKPEKPLAAVSNSLPRDGNSCGTNATASIKMPLSEVILATNAATMLQRGWRRRRPMQARQARENPARGPSSPVYSIVVDKELTLASQNGDANTGRVSPEINLGEGALSGEVHIEDGEIDRMPKSPELFGFAWKERSDVNTASLWSEDEWSFLEEGRSTGGALLDGKGEGAQMDKDELVWKFPQRVILQREARRVASLKTVYQARKTRRSNTSQWQRPAVRPMHRGSQREAAPNHQAHDPATPRKRRCSILADSGQDRRVLRLCRHRKVVQTVAQKRRTTYKRAQVGHRRSPGELYASTSTDTALSVAAEFVVEKEVATSTTSANDRNTATSLAASDASIAEKLAASQSKWDRVGLFSVPFAPVHRFVEFESTDSEDNAEKSSPSISSVRNDLINVGDLKIAGQFLIGAMRGSIDRSLVSDNVACGSTCVGANPSDEPGERDFIPLSMDIPNGDDGERTLSNGMEAASPRPNREALSNRSSSRSECFETGARTIHQDDSHSVSSSADSSTHLEARSPVQIIASDSFELQSNCLGDAKNARSDPLHSLRELESTVAQTLNRIHSRTSLRGRVRSLADSSPGYEWLSDRHPSDSASVSSVTSSDRPPTDASEQQEFRRILDDFRHYLRLSSAGASSSAEGESPASSCQLQPADVHRDEGRIDGDGDVDGGVDGDVDDDLRAMASEIRQCRQQVAQSLLPWPVGR